MAEEKTKICPNCGETALKPIRDSEGLVVGSECPICTGRELDGRNDGLREALLGNDSKGPEKK